MARRKVIYAALKEAAIAPGALGNDRELGGTKQVGLEMYTGEEPGYLTVSYKKKEIGIPLSNVKSLVWESIATRKDITDLSSPSDKSIGDLPSDRLSVHTATLKSEITPVLKASH